MFGICNVLRLSPPGPEHVLSEALCGAVAAPCLAEIRKHAAPQEGKASLGVTSTTQEERWKNLL